MITASAGRASSRRLRHRVSSSKRSTMECCNQNLSKSVDHIPVDLGEPANNFDKSRNSGTIDIEAKLHIRISLKCSRENFNRSRAEPEEFGRDHTLSTQEGSSSDDEREYYTVKPSSSTYRSSAHSVGQDPPGRGEEFGRDHTLSTQEESSSDDEREYYTGRSSSTYRSSARSIGQDPPGRGSTSAAAATSSKPIVTGSSSNIFSHYYIFPTVLGEGRYGSVRECMHLNTKQYYAVKSIKKSKIHIAHLQRELYLLSKINHKNIMRLVDVFEDAEFVHIITEIYYGGELFDKIIQRTTDVGCFDEVEAANIIKSLLEAVSYLHWKGIVHRDIKPENILFVNDYDDDLSIKLIDFGLSRRHQKGDAYMHEFLGTPYYMAPELVKGKYDQSCDIWSVGIVAYILLCGYPPFNGETDLDIFETIKQADFNFPSRAWKHVSPEAKDFIKCLLRKDPRKRFTAEEALKHPWIREGSWIRKLDCWYQQQQQ